MSYEVHEAERRAYRYEVRWMDGRSYCRCQSYRDAAKIALALNMQHDPEGTGETLRKIYLEHGE